MAMGAGIDPQGRDLENVPLERNGHGYQLRFFNSFLFYLHAIPRHHVYNEKTGIKHTMCVSLLPRAVPWVHSPAVCVLRYVAISEALPRHRPWVSQPGVASGFESCFAWQPMLPWAREGRNREKTHGGSQR